MCCILLYYAGALHVKTHNSSKVTSHGGWNSNLQKLVPVEEDYIYILTWCFKLLWVYMWGFHPSILQRTFFCFYISVPICYINICRLLIHQTFVNPYHSQTFLSYVFITMHLQSMCGNFE